MPYYRLVIRRKDVYTTLEREGLETHNQPTKVGGHKPRPRQPMLELRGCETRLLPPYVPSRSMSDPSRESQAQTSSEPLARGRVRLRRQGIETHWG